MCALLNSVCSATNDFCFHNVHYIQDMNCVENVQVTQGREVTVMHPLCVHPNVEDECAKFYPLR